MKVDIGVLISFIIYFALVLGIGAFFFRRNNSLSDYFLGGRQLNSWVTAMSAQASDMSGWLLMGLPAAAYWSGISASWIAIGLFLGTYTNWLVVAKRLRKMSAASGDAITIPEYIQNRFASKSVAVRVMCALIIFVFFLIYTASAFSAGAKLFEHVFGMPYIWALTLGAVIIISYTFMGGFLAVCWTDFFQGMLMFVAIIVVPIIAAVRTPNLSFEMLSTAKEGFLNMFGDFTGPLSAIAIISSLAWGLGYFGMPHILTRFMAIKSSSMIRKSRIIATVWVLFSLVASILVGLLGYAHLNSIGAAEFANKAAAEVIFMDLVQRLVPGFLSGILLSAIMAAVMSTADSQLLVTASAISNDIYKAVFRKKAGDKELMWVSRIAVIGIALIAYVIAIDPNSSVMGLVSYAWAGFGAAFGPVILFSLFWKRMTMKGAFCGMLLGGVTVIAWETMTASQIPFVSEVYSIIPGFVLALAAIVIVSLLDKKPGKEVDEIFKKAEAVEL